MSRRWRIVAAIYTVINVGGAVYAFAEGEFPHGALHVALLVAGAAVMLWVTGRRRVEDLPAVPHADERLDRLLQSVDAIAIEVERIGEAQRTSVEQQTKRVRENQ